MDASPRSHSTPTRQKPALSIRARLVILALLAVVPLMLDRVRLLEASRSERIGYAAAEVLELAKRGAAAQKEIVTTARALLQVMARAYVESLARGDACGQYLADLAAGIPWINGMSIVGPDGRVKCSTVPNAIGIDLSDRPYYRTAMKTRTFVVSDYIVGRLNKKPAIIAVYPTQAIDPSVNAAVFTSINLEWVNGIVSALQRKHGSSVMLIDGAGTVLAGDASASELIGRKGTNASLVREIGARNSGTIWAVGADGVRRLFGFVRLPATDARLVVGLDETDVLRDIDRAVFLAYLQLAFFGLLVLMVAWFGGERLIVDPIRSLARTAERFGRGDLRARASGQAWAKEFTPLVTALNTMAQRLAGREKDLRATNRHLEELVSIDALSGLANRRGFDARLNAEWQRAGKLRRPVALLMIDVDHFKLFNDRYGHVEGDVCLRRLAKLLMEAAGGADDLPARYGGEEFALLVPGADIDTVLATAETLRRAVENLYIAHASSPLGQVTVSIGTAAMVPGVGENAECLVEAADIGLYAAKRRGRNAVVAHGGIVLDEAARARHGAAASSL